MPLSPARVPQPAARPPLLPSKPAPTPPTSSDNLPAPPAEGLESQPVITRPRASSRTAELPQQVQNPVPSREVGCPVSPAHPSWLWGPSQSALAAPTDDHRLDTSATDRYFPRVWSWEVRVPRLPGALLILACVALPPGVPARPSVRSRLPCVFFQIRTLTPP